MCQAGVWHIRLTEGYAILQRGKLRVGHHPVAGCLCFPGRFVLLAERFANVGVDGLAHVLRSQDGGALIWEAVSA